jgi:hypothetical protein
MHLLLSVPAFIYTRQRGRGVLNLPVASSVTLS